MASREELLKKVKDFLKDYRTLESEQKKLVREFLEEIQEETDANEVEGLDELLKGL